MSKFDIMVENEIEIPAAPFHWGPSLGQLVQGLGDMPKYSEIKCIVGRTLHDFNGFDIIERGGNELAALKFGKRQVGDEILKLTHLDFFLRNYKDHPVEIQCEHRSYHAYCVETDFNRDQEDLSCVILHPSVSCGVEVL